MSATSGRETAEDGNGIGGKREGLEKMYQMGVRLISITWNMENCLGYPNSFDPEKMALPLKPFGCEMVDAMNKMGVIVDVSHLSDGGFWDVVRICKENHKPFVASHSACRDLFHRTSTPTPAASTTWFAT